jgi:hypothetical protein
MNFFYVLTLCVSLGLGEPCVTRSDVLSVQFETHEKCEETKSHNVVQQSYRDVFPNKEVMLYCKIVRE